MNDPHVETLHYSIRHGEHVDYTGTAAMEHETPDFFVRLADGRVQITMKSHFASVAEARALVELIRRAAEVAFDPNAIRPQVTMADLRSLSGA